MLGDGQRFVACARGRVDDQEVQIASFHVGVELADGRNVLQAAHGSELAIAADIGYLRQPRHSRQIRAVKVHVHDSHPGLVESPIL